MVQSLEARARRVTLGQEGSILSGMGNNTRDVPQEEHLPATDSSDRRVVDEIRKEVIRFTQVIQDTLGATKAEMEQALEGARDYWRLRADAAEGG
jgi:hypothetical protein